MAADGVAREQGGGRTTTYDGSVWTAQRVWFVHTTDKNDREDTASTASGLPFYGEAHPAPIGAAMYAKTITYKTQSNVAEKIWIVTAGYTSERTLHANDASQDEILTSFMTEIYQEDFWQDEDENAVCNSAGDPFLDPSPTRENANGIFKIRSNQASIPASVLTYRNAVNSSSCTIGGLPVAEKTAKIMRMEVGERQLRGSTVFYPFSIEVHVHDRGWRFKPLDQGLRQRDPEAGLIHCRNRPGDGQKITAPIMLNGAGVALEDPSPANAVFGDFKKYPELEFAGLPGIT